MRLVRKIPATRFGKLLPLLAVAVALAPAAWAIRAQQQPLPPMNTPGQIGPKPPVGSGGCSVTAPTCADVAPTIIHNALEPSPLGHNVRFLTTASHGQKSGSDLGKRVAQWAVEAFRNAGVDDARVENDSAMGSFETQNVVAVIHGRAQTKGFVILGAGLESQNPAAASLDAACNVALVVDAARAIHRAGIRPLRSIGFVLFGGGKRGVAGSRAYVRAHRSELDRADAVIIYDAGDGPVTGYDLEGRKSLEAPLRKALAPASQFGAGHDTYAPEMESAAFGFVLEGVPTIVTNPQGHSRSPRTVNLPALKRHVALAALTAYGIADLPERLGTRLTRPQIRQLLKRTGLKGDMKTAGTQSRQWQGQGSGRR